MRRKISQQMITVLMLLLMVYSSMYLSQADDPYPNDANRSINGAGKRLNGKYQTADNLRDNLIIARGIMDILVGKWEANKAAISNGATMTVASAFGIAVGAYISAGTLAAAAVASLVVNAEKLGLAIYDNSDLVTSMEAAINKVSELTSQANIAVNAYHKEYDRYIQIMAAHLGYDAAWLEADVKASLTDDDVYEHPTDPHSSGSRGSHFVYTRQDITIPSLPDNYECEGPCTNTFNSPYKAFDSHREKCGTAKSVDREFESSSNVYYVPGTYGNPERRYRSSKSEILRNRNLLEGCGRHYYDCPDFPDTEHQVFSCNRTKTNQYGTSVRCGTQFRPCMGHKEDHDLSDLITLEGKHSITPDSSSGEEGSTEHQTIAPDPAPTPTPSYHTCGVHETWQSGDHSAAGCDTSGHYVCDGSDHSYTYCYVTDANGNTCTVGNYYACDGHTHQYPEPQSQYMTCAYGHTYDTTVQSQVDFHRTKTCKWCGGTWKDCGDVTPYCPTWTTAHHKCSEPSHTCDLCD